MTASPVLRNEVRKFFRSLVAGEHGLASTLKKDSRLECGLDYPSLLSVHTSEFPLFLTKREWLVILDGTLQQPFFPRVSNGVVNELTTEAAGYAWGRMESASSFILAECFNEYDSDYEDDYDDNDLVREVLDDGKVAFSNHKNFKVEVDYEYFLVEIYRHIPGAKEFSASLLWCEFTSFIKGSIESMETGFLSEIQYAEVGRKRAPNFKCCRQKIYQMFLEYEKIKKRIRGFDLCDLVHHIVSQLLPSYQRRERIQKTLRTGDQSLFQIVTQRL
jgi:hypothetical protein